MICGYCGMALVQRPKEKLSNFLKRKHCSKSHAAKHQWTRQSYRNTIVEKRRAFNIFSVLSIIDQGRKLTKKEVLQIPVTPLETIPKYHY